MTVNWTSEDGVLHTAECVLGVGQAVHLLVESLGEHGWDWQVWNPNGRCRTHYGVADTLRAAKARAELALVSELTSRGKRAA